MLAAVVNQSDCLFVVLIQSHSFICPLPGESKNLFLLRLAERTPGVALFTADNWLSYWVDQSLVHRVPEFYSRIGTWLEPWSCHWNFSVFAWLGSTDTRTATPPRAILDNLIRRLHPEQSASGYGRVKVSKQIVRLTCRNRGRFSKVQEAAVSTYERFLWCQIEFVFHYVIHKSFVWFPWSGGICWD